MTAAIRRALTPEMARNAQKEMLEAGKPFIDQLVKLHEMFMPSMKVYPDGRLEIGDLPPELQKIAVQLQSYANEARLSVLRRHGLEELFSNGSLETSMNTCG